MNLPEIPRIPFRCRWIQLENAAKKIEAQPIVRADTSRFQKVWPEVRMRLVEFFQQRQVGIRLTRIQERVLVSALTGGIETGEWDRLKRFLSEDKKDAHHAAIDYLLATGSNNGRRLRNLFEIYPEHLALARRLGDVLEGDWSYVTNWPKDVVAGLRAGLGLQALAKFTVGTRVPLTGITEKLNITGRSALHLEVQKAAFRAATWKWLEPQVENLLTEVDTFDVELQGLFFSAVFSALAIRGLSGSQLCPAPSPFENVLRIARSKLGDPRKQPGRWAAVSEPAVAVVKEWMIAGDFRTALADFQGDPARKEFWRGYWDHVMDCRYFPSADVQGHTTSAICIVIAGTVFTEFGAVGNALYYWNLSKKDIWKFPDHPTLSSLKPDKQRSFHHRNRWQPKLQRLIYNRTRVRPRNRLTTMTFRGR